MAADEGYTITAELVAEWEATVADLQRKIAAAKVFLPADATSALDPDSEPKNFMGEIFGLANGSAKPIAKAELKEMLKKRGFPEHQVGGTYFYLAIKKLKDAQRITVQPDGSIWKGLRRI